MNNADFIKVLIACIGFGAGSEAIRRYRGFKHRRRGMIAVERNAGFWTDSRLYHAEAAVAAVAMALPFSAIMFFVTADRPIWVGVPVLLAYALGVYLLIRGMNVGEPQ
jgi:uncharacterized membrane protein YbhN (UPF0104 family)